MIAIRAKAAHGFAAARRQAAALSVSPALRLTPRAIWRNAALTWGMLPHRPGERASSNVNSRTT